MALINEGFKQSLQDRQRIEGRVRELQGTSATAGIAQMQQTAQRQAEAAAARQRYQELQSVRMPGNYTPRLQSALQQAAGVSAQNVQGATAAPVQQYGGAKISVGGAGGASQQDAMGMMRQAAMGQGPSAAQAQMQRGLGQAIAASRSAAASAKGVNPALAQRMAAQGIAQQTADVASQAAALRAQEQQAAMSQYGGMAEAQRGQDIGLASQQAQLTQQAGLQGAAQQQQMAQFNAGQLQQAALANQGADLQAQQASLAATGQLIGMGMSHEQAQAQLNLGLMGQQTQRQLSAAQIRAAQQAAASAQSAADRDFWRNTLVGLGTQIVGGVAGGAGAQLAMSDERVKTDIEPAAVEVRTLLDAIRPFSFEYKDGEGDRNYGLMAQDLEKSEAGRTLVEERDGIKRVDTGKLAMAIAAAAADLNDRVEKLEGRA